MDDPARPITPVTNQLMVPSRVRKHSAIESSMETGDGQESDDWVSEKVRAIAGPNQKQLDQV